MIPTAAARACTLPMSASTHTAKDCSNVVMGFAREYVSTIANIAMFASAAARRARDALSQQNVSHMDGPSPPRPAR